LELEVRDGDLVFHPRPVRKLALRGVPAASLDALMGSVHLGGDAVKEKQRLYER
jgi:hypothetical protein